MWNASPASTSLIAKVRTTKDSFVSDMRKEVRADGRKGMDKPSPKNPRLLDMG